VEGIIKDMFNYRRLVSVVAVPVVAKTAPSDSL
jgi:hypothetical protein